MNSTSNNGNESPPEEEDRSLLFGPRKERTEPAGDKQKPRRPDASASSPPRTSPPAAKAAASTDAAQQQILAKLEGLEGKLASSAAGETDLAAAARTIAKQVEQMRLATEWVNDIKAAISEILASTGKQIEGLKSGNEKLDGALTQLTIAQEGLTEVQIALVTTATDLNQRLSELKSVEQGLAGHYSAWTAEAKASRDEMKALSGRLGAGDHMVTRLKELQEEWTGQTAKAITDNAEAITKNAEAQSAAATKIDEIADTFDTKRSEFLHDCETAREEALKKARREWKWARRLIGPVLAALLLLAGAVGQNEFGVFDAYDYTGGWKDAVWEVHGNEIKACYRESRETKSIVRCSLEVY